MTIYLDVVLIENLCMNYIILFGTGYILKMKLKHIRLIASALLGGVYSILAYTNVLQIYSNIIAKILLSIVMVYIAYNPRNIKLLTKQIIIFYLTSFVFGGCSFALLYFVKPQDILMKNGTYIGTYPLKIALLGGIVGFTITVIAFKTVKYRLSKNDMFCEIKIFFGQKSINAKAMIDTGNLLKDPITRIPVIVVEKDILYEIIPCKILDNLEQIVGGDIRENEIYEEEFVEYISKFRVIPFNSLGKQNGLLLGFKASKVITYIDANEEELKNVIIGIYDKKLSKKDKYNALLGLEILEGSKENEFITSTSK
ncbi:MAG: sigma-E processing peptidase SpoIIGA [Clostridia bacterium]|nr:sigma-E processing peptidase SpoIIGA [Clostridia bacterium]